MSLSLKVSTIFIIFIHSVTAGSILVIFQDPSYSHEYTYFKILKSLANRGHQLTIFSSYTFDYDLNPNVMQHKFIDSNEIYRKHLNISYGDQRKLSWFQLVQYEFKAFQQLASYQMSHPELQKIIHNPKDYHFDAIIVECYVYNFALLAELYDCPIINFLASEPTIGVHELFQNDIHPAIYSDSTRFPFIHGQLSLAERIKSTIYFFIYHFIVLGMIYPYYLNKVAVEHPMNVTKSVFQVLDERLALMIINTSPDIGHVRPLMPNVVQVGFFHVDEPKEVTNEIISNFLDASSIDGVLIVCFGSKIKNLDLGMNNVHKILSAFNQTKLNVLWKYDDDLGDFEVPSNVLISKWLPLADVLAHKNVKAIVHHGGLLTCYEAIAREVPQIIIPIVYDEGSNAMLMEQRKVAVQLDLNSLEVDLMVGAIHEVIKPVYKENVMKLKHRVYDKLIDRKELAVWSIENVIKYKNEMKFKRNAYNTFFQRWLLDQIVVIVIVIYGVKKIVGKFLKGSG